MRGARSDALVADGAQRTEWKQLCNGPFIRVCGVPVIRRGAWQCVASRYLRLYVRKVEQDEEARSAALSLLARGMLTPGQAAELAGVSRQLVYYWLKQHGIDWQRAWSRRQAGMWRREIAALNGKVLRPPTKKALRRRATRAKAEFDARPHKPPG
jgi:hypothetical protein